jgi:hypothetical protein
MDAAQPLDIWAIVEVMGHKKFAGRVTERTIGGSALVQVDVPETLDRQGQSQPAFTKLIGVGSIYCITPTDEETARKAARALRAYEADPLPVYIPQERQLPAAVPARDEEEADWDTPLDDNDDEPL